MAVKRFWCAKVVRNTANTTNGPQHSSSSQGLPSIGESVTNNTFTNNSFSANTKAPLETVCWFNHIATRPNSMQFISMWKLYVCETWIYMEFNARTSSLRLMHLLPKSKIKLPNIALNLVSIVSFSTLVLSKSYLQVYTHHSRNIHST